MSVDAELEQEATEETENAHKDCLMAIMDDWGAETNRQRCASEEETMGKIRRAMPEAQREPAWTQAPDSTMSVKHVWRV
jgi:hypothetical protein